MATDRKIVCTITTNRSDYGRLKPVMEEIKKEPRLELKVVAGSHLYFDHLLWYLRHGEPLSWLKSLPWYLRARATSLLYGDKGVIPLEYPLRILKEDNFPIHARIPMFLEGGNPRVMIKTSGFALLGIYKIFERLKPDLILINGDRFEILPIAFAAAYANILLVHIEGGDVSGTIDESIRHTITKLAHIHFPATQTSAQRIRAMGENPDYIFPVGSPVIDLISRLDLTLDNSVLGSKKYIDLTKPFILIMHHPVTTRYKENKHDMEELIAAIHPLPIQKLFLSPNIDAGSDGVSTAIREYRESNPTGAAFFKVFSTQDFYRILKNTSVAVGNSSSFIREAAFLGTPAVLVGDRQQGRERGKNVIEVEPRREKIREAVKIQLAHGPYPQDLRFGDGQASRKIVEILANMDLSKISVQKQFYE